MNTNEASETTASPAAAELGAHVAPEKAHRKKCASQKNGAPKGKKEAHSAKAVAPKKAAATKKEVKATKKVAKAARAKETGSPREGSKTSQVIAILKREGGTTLEEIMTRMKWQKHTTRAMLSAGGSLTKKHGLIVTSEKVGDKRVYSIKR